MIKSKNIFSRAYTLPDLVKDNLDKPWGWRLLSQNPQVTLDFIKEMLITPADIYVDSKKVTWDQIKANPTKDWNWRELSKNVHLTWDFIESTLFLPNGEETPWNWEAILKHPNITWDIITTKINTKYWYWSSILENPNITWENLNTMVKKLGSERRFLLDWKIISCSPTVTWDIILSNSEGDFIEWNWSGISMNPNITWDIIQNNPNKPWNWKSVLLNPNITWDIIVSNPFIAVCDATRSFRRRIQFFRKGLISQDEFISQWKWEHISKNPNITWDIIQANLDKPWDWSIISQSPNITWDIIKANLGKQIKWVYSRVILNPNITIDILLNEFSTYRGWDWSFFDYYGTNPNITKLYKIDKNIYTEYCSGNPNITWEFIQKFPQSYFNTYELSMNSSVTD